MTYSYWYPFFTCSFFNFAVHSVVVVFLSLPCFAPIPHYTSFIDFFLLIGSSLLLLLIFNLFTICILIYLVCPLFPFSSLVCQYSQTAAHCLPIPVLCSSCNSLSYALKHFSQTSFFPSSLALFRLYICKWACFWGRKLTCGLFYFFTAWNEKLTRQKSGSGIGTSVAEKDFCQKDQNVDQRWPVQDAVSKLHQ